ncbi:DMT family transporter [Mangrovivirga sp. M17]|uniref:DMT family transporter n=1 Tax=Mangrovivirga halotolerans TaxID=2993936 RepID=A0ABT3RL41_9BACT|nr:DMT family transporter [Mangrovivirga halotolerans]MCX2742429.1 DMT family transporter [Mangrovivirga halotolerans]
MPGKDFLKLHLIVFAWGFTAILGKLISIPAVEMVFYRTLFAAIIIFFLLRIKRIKIGVPQKDFWRLLGTGLIIGAHWIMFFGSIKVSNASIALTGMATASLWTSILEPIVLGRRILWYEVLLGTVVIIGLAIIFSLQLENIIGVIMALLSAFLASSFSIINSRFTRKYDPYAITFYEMAGATISIALFFPLYQLWFTNGAPLQLGLTGMDFLYLLILAGVCTVYAFSASVEIMRRVSAFSVNLAINMEPIYGILMAVALFPEEEKMTPQFYLGAVIILAAVFSYPLFQRLHKRRMTK